jgi:hypothetical protein
MQETSYLEQILVIALGIILSKILVNVYDIVRDYLELRYQRYTLVKSSLNIIDVANTQLGETTWFPILKNSMKLAGAVGFPLFVFSDLIFKAYGKSGDPVDTIFSTVKTILEENGYDQNESQQLKQSQAKSKRRGRGRQQINEDTSYSNNSAGGINIGNITKTVMRALMEQE